MREANSTSFKKGHIPWSKGTKGVLKANSGSFVKGQKAHNKKEWINKICKCGKEFSVKPSLDRVKTCSRSCGHKGRKQSEASNQLRSDTLKGRLTHRIISREESRPQWKGDNVSYRSLHKWVEVYRGKPMICEHCSDSTKSRYEWANVSREYKRELTDWIRLCKKCHIAYDNNQSTRAYLTRKG